MTDNDKEKISAELANIQREIADISKEIILLSKYRKATAALLANLETLYNEEYAARNALFDERWTKNFDDN